MRCDHRLHLRLAIAQQQFSIDDSVPALDSSSSGNSEAAMFRINTVMERGFLIYLSRARNSCRRSAFHTQDQTPLFIATPLQRVRQWSVPIFVHLLAICLSICPHRALSDGVGRIGNNGLDADVTATQPGIPTIHGLESIIRFLSLVRLIKSIQNLLG